jgi:hypothetical protein
MTDATAKLEKPTPCRFHSEQQKKLIAAGRRFRMRPAALIRQAVDEALQRWENGEPIIVRQTKA